MATRSTASLATGLMLLSWCLGGCRDEPPSAVPVEAEPAETAGSREAGHEEGDDSSEGDSAEKDPLDPLTFAGFSKDESLFAYAAYSKGAGVHLFTVVGTSDGGRVTDFPLDGEQAVSRARELLVEHGFSRESDVGIGALGREETLRLEAETGSVRVWLVHGDDRVLLEPPKPMAAVAQRLRNPEVDLWGFSPSGAFIALRLTEEQGPILGQAVTYQVLNLQPARLALR